MKKTLLVDDDLDFVEVIKARLEANNYSVVTVTDAEEIFLATAKETPDIIILDIVMPDMDGYQVCERLRKGKETKDIPILLLTGKELEPGGIAERCLELGVEGYLLKPIDSKELLTKIEKVLKESNR